jgi:ABC-type Fe3+-hydroxamate transport system substrate-binding protein
MEKGSNDHSKALHFTSPPQRVVSLVPSMTESLFELGLGSALVGVTDYCIHPAEAVAGLPHLGGPKNPRVDEILALKPDLVLANWEENTRPTVEALEAAGVAVWVTFPQTVLESLEVLWKLVELFHSHEAGLRLRTLELTLDWAISSVDERRTVRYFCPIWQETTQSGQTWWMTFNRRTYPSDLLLLIGGENAFADRERRYPLRADLGLEAAQDPGERDTRYPRVTAEEVIAAQPQVILLPDEPFAFGEEHSKRIADLLAETPAAQKGRIYPIDGSLITWHGTRLARALRELPAVLELPAGGQA